MASCVEIYIHCQLSWIEHLRPSWHLLSGVYHVAEFSNWQIQMFITVVVKAIIQIHVKLIK